MANTPTLSLTHVHTYTYTRTHAHTHMHTYIYIYTHTISPSLPPFLSPLTNIHTHTNTHSYYTLQGYRRSPTRGIRGERGLPQSARRSKILYFSFTRRAHWCEVKQECLYGIETDYLLLDLRLRIKSDDDILILIPGLQGIDSGPYVSIIFILWRTR